VSPLHSLPLLFFMLFLVDFLSDRRQRQLDVLALAVAKPALGASLCRAGPSSSFSGSLSAALLSSPF
jgi:hypothetical protein